MDILLAVLITLLSSIILLTGVAYFAVKIAISKSKVDTTQSKVIDTNLVNNSSVMNHPLLIQDMQSKFPGLNPALVESVYNALSPEERPQLRTYCTRTGPYKVQLKVWANTPSGRRPSGMACSLAGGNGIHPDSPTIDSSVLWEGMLCEHELAFMRGEDPIRPLNDNTVFEVVNG